MESLINGSLRAVTVITNTWAQSCRLYHDAFGYTLQAEGELTAAQKAMFGSKLGRYALWGFEQGAVVRLIELNDPDARPIREGAQPYDPGMAIIEAGTPDVDAAYSRVLRARFGAVSAPKDFYAKGPEPLGEVFMRSVAILGAAGEQVFVTQITQRKGGVSLLNDKAVAGINVPGNVAFSLPNRAAIEQFWTPVMGLVPVTDIPMHDPNVPELLGAPADLHFEMVLLGYGLTRVGIEFYTFSTYQPPTPYRVFPTSFDKTGLAVATYPTPDVKAAITRLREAGCEIISELGLPNRTTVEPEAVLLRGPVGEIIELC